MASSVEQRFLFIHVMKTAGTSFADQISANFGSESLYPEAVRAPGSTIGDLIETYNCVPTLVREANARKESIRLVRGHVPYSVRALLEAEFVALTILREPVARTLSYLKHCKRHHKEHHDLSLEEIYDDPWFNETFLHNYQTKIFSMSAREALMERRMEDGEHRLPPRTELLEGKNLPDWIPSFVERHPARFMLECFSASTGVIAVDEARLATAKENLSLVDLVGITEAYDRFLAAIEERYGWTVKPMPKRHVGQPGDISRAFAQRIAEDNTYDMELYEFARRRVHEE